MRLHRLFIALSFLGTFFCSTAFAEEGASALYEKIRNAHNAGSRFTTVSLFDAASGNKHLGVLSEETLLQPRTQDIISAFKAKENAVSIQLHSDNGAAYTLELMKANLFSDNPNIGVINQNGRERVAYNDGLHYQGAVAGHPHSMASVSLFSNGDVMILFSTEDGNFIVGRLEDNSGKYIFYNDKNMLHKVGAPCGVTEKDYSKAEKQQTAAKGTRVQMCNKVKVYWECDYDLYRRKGLVLTNAQNYVTGLFNQFQTLYANEKIVIELKSLYIWTISDDYPSATSNVGLTKFRAFWNNMNNGFDGDLAHLITMDSSADGGLGYVDVLCSRSYAYSYSEITGSYQTVPTYSWDAMVVTHETGHNLGSNHTHWCGWNTGAGGSCGSIDNCTTQENGSSCNTCPTTFNNNTSGWQGTVMSYCHLVSRGISLANGFGPLPGTLIRDNVSSASCLSPVISATIVTTPICNADGSMTVSFLSDNNGVPPYSYAWSNSGTTQAITGITSPDPYMVFVRDSNNCEVMLEANAYNSRKTGNGQAVTGMMPICCQNTTRKLTLKASAPQYLNYTCETIAWLRTTSPITSYNAFKTAFDAASPADIHYSTNESSINFQTGATLDIQPPVSCTQPVTDYYTPFVSDKLRSPLSITGNTTGSSPLMMNVTTPIGGVAMIPVQTALVTGCYTADTPSSMSLVVTVSGYTGRANKMTLTVQTNSDYLLYSEFALNGNGVYTIPMTKFKDLALGALKIKAYDFNCTNSTTCSTSAATLTAQRIVYYDSVVAPRPVITCAVGTSIRVDYAPTNCTNLSVGNSSFLSDMPSIYPNPASKTATLKFNAVKNGNATLLVTDMLGKVVNTLPVNYHQGGNAVDINVAAFAKGVYFVSLGNDDNTAARLKLVVE